MSETLSDCDKIVAQYRATIEHLEVQMTPEGKQEFKSIAMRLRQQWKAWQGEDSMHEMSFGEPEA